jgi:hypothetical protein
MRKMKVVLAAVALVLVIPFLSGHGEEKKLADLMHKKLENSQKVLEGLALNDFKMIAKHAEELLELSKEAEWKVIKTPQYEIHSSDFRRTAETLVKNAKEKNLDAAALSYVELTLTCVKCHKHVREKRMTRAD